MFLKEYFLLDCTIMELFSIGFVIHMGSVFPFTFANIRAFFFIRSKKVISLSHFNNSI
ncbi:hypothetical protein SAMN05216455_104153 [Segatella bryantii]|nr:hypothetical protein SAMN05216455_104153 [Segatella bryantii]